MKQVREKLSGSIDKFVRQEEINLMREFLLLNRIWEGVTTVMLTSNFRRNDILRIVQELNQIR